LARIAIRLRVVFVAELVLIKSQSGDFVENAPVILRSHRVEPF